MVHTSSWAMLRSSRPWGGFPFSPRLVGGSAFPPPLFNGAAVLPSFGWNELDVTFENKLRWNNLEIATIKLMSSKYTTVKSSGGLSFLLHTFCFLRCCFLILVVLLSLRRWCCSPFLLLLVGGGFSFAPCWVELLAPPSFESYCFRPSFFVGGAAFPTFSMVVFPAPPFWCFSSSFVALPSPPPLERCCFPHLLMNGAAFSLALWVVLLSLRPLLRGAVFLRLRWVVRPCLLLLDEMKLEHVTICI